MTSGREKYKTSHFPFSAFMFMVAMSSMIINCRLQLDVPPCLEIMPQLKGFQVYYQGLLVYYTFRLITSTSTRKKEFWFLPCRFFLVLLKKENIWSML